MKKSRILIVIAFAALLAISPAKAFAAKLSFEVSANPISVGDTRIISVMLDSEGTNVNALDGSIDVSSLGASIVNLPIAHSAFSLWPRTPSISPDGSEITFSGGIPGGMSDKGTVFQIVVSAKNAGSLMLTPHDVTAYANDGKGTLVAVASPSFKLSIASEKSTPVNELESSLTSDNTPPENFSIVSGSDPSVYDGKTFIAFNAVDEGSGIDHYEVKEGNLDAVRSGTTYMLRNPNAYEKVFVSAFDKANNVRTETYRTPFKFSFAFFVDVLIALAVILGLGILIRRMRK